MCSCLHFYIPGFPRHTITCLSTHWPPILFLSKYPASHHYTDHGTLEGVREAGQPTDQPPWPLLSQVWSSTSCWWVTRPSGTRTSTACTPRSRRGRMITPARSGTLSPPRSSHILIPSSDVSRDDNCPHFRPRTWSTRCWRWTPLRGSGQRRLWSTPGSARGRGWPLCSTGETWRQFMFSEHVDNFLQ